MSTRTGPGRPVEATWNASPIVRAMSSGLVTRKLCFVIGKRDTGDVGLLEAVGADQVGRHLPGDGDDRDRVHVGVGDRRDQVRGARAAGRHADADAPGGLGVPGGRVTGALLVPDQDVPDHLGVEQRVVGRQDRAARDAEHHVCADPLERVDQRLGPGGPDLARAGDLDAGGLGAGPCAGTAAPTCGAAGAGASAGRGWASRAAGCGERAARSRGLGAEGPVAAPPGRSVPAGPLRPVICSVIGTSPLAMSIGWIRRHKKSPRA